MKIAVDAMGGDHAPKEIVEGCVSAAREYGTELILVGRQERIEEELKRLEATDLPITFRHAEDVVEMGDSVAQAIRRKRDSSISAGIQIVASGEAGAFLSAGNTGVVMAQATRTLGLIEGTRRPAIAQALPTYHGYTVLIDVGANVDCRPEDLVQFAIMGDLYAQAVMDESAPKVGLLSVGTEEAKGSPLTKQALALLRETPLNFVGNVEGSDIFNGTLDVVVCDGFTGNVVLKLAESLVELLETALLEELLRTKKSKLGLKLSKVALRRFKHRFDHAEIGCAPLLGVNGVVAISHGRSKARSIHNAIRRAQEIVSFNLNQRIREALSQIDQPSPNSAKKLL